MWLHVTPCVLSLKVIWCWAVGHHHILSGTVIWLVKVVRCRARTCLGYIVTWSLLHLTSRSHLETWTKTTCCWNSKALLFPWWRSLVGTDIYVSICCNVPGGSRKVSCHASVLLLSPKGSFDAASSTLCVWNGTDSWNFIFGSQHNFESTTAQQICILAFFLIIPSSSSMSTLNWRLIGKNQPATAALGESIVCAHLLVMCQTLQGDKRVLSALPSVLLPSIVDLQGLTTMATRQILSTGYTHKNTYNCCSHCIIEQDYFTLC